MKKKINGIMALLTMVLLVGSLSLSFTACDNGNGNGDKSTGGTVNAPTLDEKTHDSITIIAPSAPSTGQDIEYGINTTNGTPSTWQDELTFDGLEPETDYFIFARAKENANYYAGTPSTALEVTTEEPPGFTITSAAELSSLLADINGGDTADNPIKIILNVDNLGGIFNEQGSIGNIIGASNKYISLDLSDSNLTSIVSNALRDCTKLTSVIIGDSVESIGNTAFYNCTNLSNIIMGENVKTIGSQAFRDCTSLTNIIIGNNVESIGLAAFNNCTSLSSVIIGDSVKTIGEQAFHGCTSLSSVIMGNSVESIGNQAFRKCNLSSIVIPASVKSIGSSVFIETTTLTSVTFEGTIDSDSFDTNAFNGLSALRDVFYATDSEKGTPGIYTREPGKWVWELVE